MGTSSRTCPSTNARFAWALRGVYQYSPRVPKAELMRTLVNDFVEKALGNSLSPFMAYLARDANVSEAELKELTQAELEASARRAAALLRRLPT